MASQQKFKVIIPSKYKDKIKESHPRKIGEQIIDYIITRSISDNEDKNNKKFPAYNEKYAISKGVSKNDVDLFLSGEMLTNMKVLSANTNEIEIGYDKGDDINGKVEGNVKGTYGQPIPIPGKKRDFLGVTNSMRDQIIEEVIGEKEKSGIIESAIGALSTEIAQAIIKGLSFGK